jgi:lactoylglutathione lyase
MAAMPNATGLFETHLTVSDLERSIAFYRDVVGLSVGLVLEDRPAAFFWVGGRGEGMLGLWPLGSAPMGLCLHIALEATLNDVLAACDRLRSNGITPLSFFGAETSEPSVIGWMPAAAVYFRDPDGHLIEYLAMLEEPARAERGIVSWSHWRSRDPRTEAIRVERYVGRREELRALFEAAEDSASELNGYIDAGDVLVAIASDGVVGHLQLIHGAGTSEIKSMAVAAPYRGRGIGRTLIDTAIDQARAHGHSTLVVATAAADVGNLRFYQLAGFRMRTVDRDAFTAVAGYPAGMVVDGIRLLDRVWLDRDLNPTA